MLSKKRPRLKWFMALNEASGSFDNYVSMVKVAVSSALEHTRLDPHFVYDGKENALTCWLRDHGVTVLPYRSYLYEHLKRLADAKKNPGILSIGAGAFLRVELPLLARAAGIEDRYVLYTDCDVLFLGDVCDQLSRLTPRYFAVAPQQDKGDYEAMNSGVMLMNLDGLAAEDARFKEFTIEHLEEFSVTSWDQMAYRRYYGRPRNAKYQWDRLGPEFNWKPYWGVSDKARIVHFHGPKPFQESMLDAGHAPKGLASMGGVGFKAYCSLWREALDRAQQRPRVSGVQVVADAIRKPASAKVAGEDRPEPALGAWVHKARMRGPSHLCEDFAEVSEALGVAGHRRILGILAKSTPVVYDFAVPDDKRPNLDHFGIRADLLGAVADGSEPMEARLRSMASLTAQVPARRSLPQETVDALKYAGLGTAHYLDTAFAAHGLLLRDIVSGEVLRSSHSVLLDAWHIVYQFRGWYEYQLVVGRWRGERLALMVPALGLVVLFKFEDRTEAANAWTVQLMAQMEALQLSHMTEVRALPQGPIEKLTVQVGLRRNLGHQVWQELSGLEDIISRWGARRVDRIVVGPMASFDVRRIFPELSHCEVVSLASDDQAVLFRESLRSASQIIRPVGQYISRSLRQHIIADAQRTLHPSKLEEIRKAGAEYKLIWLNLRAHNKRWLGQREGYASIIESLRRRHANVGVVLDGWADTREEAVALKALLPGEVPVFDTIACPLNESIAWADHVSAYCSVVGSGLVINSWIASKPGFAHGNRAHLRQQRFWNHVVESDFEPTFLKPNEVSGSDDLYGDYDFDWRIAADSLLRALE